MGNKKMDIFYFYTEQEQEHNYFIIPRSERIKTNSSILFSINKEGQLIKPIEWGSVANRKYLQAENISDNLGVELFTDLKGSLLKERLTIRSVSGKEFDLFEVLVGFFKLIRKDCLKMMNKNYQTIVSKSKKKKKEKEKGKGKGKKQQKNKSLTISKIRFVFSIPKSFNSLTIRKLRLVFKQAGFIKNLDDRQHLLFVHESVASAIWVTNQKIKEISQEQNDNQNKNTNSNNINHTNNNNNNNNKENLNSLVIISVGARTTNCVKVKQIKKIPINGELKNKYLSYNKIILQPESIQIESSPQNKLIGVYDCDLNFRRFFERLFQMKKPFNQYCKYYNNISKQWEEIKKKIRPEWRFQNNFEILNIPIGIISKEDLVSKIQEFYQTKNNKNGMNFENSILFQKKFKRSNFMNHKKSQSKKNKNLKETETKTKTETEIEIEIKTEMETEMKMKKGKLRVGELIVNKKDRQISTVELFVSRKILYSFLSNLQEEISNFVGKFTNENKEMLVNDTEIVCISGFSNSNLLKHLMNCQFRFTPKDQKKPTLNFDEYYSNGAVIKGSIIFGLYQDIITNQKICKTVGFTKLKSISTKTNQNKESNSFKNLSNNQIPEESFQVIINKNQSYPINKIFKFEIEIDILKFPELICLISTSQSSFNTHLIHDTKCNGQLSLEHQMKIFLDIKKSFKNLNKKKQNTHLIKLQFEFSFIGAEMIIKLINLKNNKALPVLVEYNYAGLWNTSVNLDYHLIKKKYKPFLSHELNNYYHNKIKNQLKSNNKNQNRGGTKEKIKEKHKNKKNHTNNNKHQKKHKNKKKTKKKKKHKRKSKRKSPNNEKKGRRVENDIGERGNKEKGEKQSQKNTERIEKDGFINNRNGDDMKNKNEGDDIKNKNEDDEKN
ncbi:glycoprotein 96-92-related-related [Anaeramoeba flamelloides]|uniref:Glycoprotein 96-92-related-related n=1 Tax=Anaeramoeba flamelloides TaxID=1746091 RepID=A0ABQ8XBD5_9EUKA|nr:glycoprotein 96-92-related-related [Anaeramoeba flamelloides]